MMNNNYTNFWNDIQVNTGVVDEDFVKPKVDHIALAGYRRAIANFVNIVTNRSDIKVRYQQNGDSYTDGKTVTIGSKIDEKNFDHVVGLALHEGSHILLSDFNFLRQLRQNTPEQIMMLGEDLGFTRGQIVGHLKNMLNYVEDRRIDYYVFSTSPGYKGYYHAMYDKYFHSPAITRALKNNTFGNDLTLENYMNRIINFTNKESDLDALPDLRRIYQRIFSSVKHLDDMNGAFNVACDCLQMVYNNLTPLPEFDGTQIGPDGQGGKAGGQGQMSKTDMYDKAANQLQNGDYKGYQETMDEISAMAGGAVEGPASKKKKKSKAKAAHIMELSDEDEALLGCYECVVALFRRARCPLPPVHRSSRADPSCSPGAVLVSTPTSPSSAGGGARGRSCSCSLRSLMADDSFIIRVSAGAAPAGAGR